MTDILADYHRWHAEQPVRIGTHSADCHLWPRHDRCMIDRLAAEVERLRQVLSQENSGTETAGNCHVMTGPEREAIRYFAQWNTWPAAAVHAKALEAYDERTK